MTDKKNLVGIQLNLRPREEVVLMEEIIPIEGKFTIFFNGVPAGNAELSQFGMRVWNLSARLIFDKEEMRLNQRRTLLRDGVDALKEDYLNNIYPKK